ncbi:LD-carboxypeptidase [bacterium SCSIO 12643]|nr:LD-carboxypeptidase [bacterium SCSIO 12643]
MGKNISPLEKGDLVLIITPAKAIEKKDVDAAVTLFENWGLKVEVGKNALGKHHYFSATDQKRAEDLQWALDHPKAKAIVCARGGYGTIRIVHQVDYAKFSELPKWMIGFSDITVLHNKMNCDLTLPSIHAVAPLYFDRLDEGGETLMTLKNAMFGESYRITFNSGARSVNGRTEGELIGGNLAILESLIGTNLDIETKGKILFLEDVSEYAYKLDRMLWSLKYSGKLDNLKGLIIGGFTDIKSADETFGCTVEDLILEVVGDKNYPIAFDFPAGHQLDNRALILGKTHVLQVEGEFSFLECIE